ncbi:MAG: hypothetical protein KC502_19400 [Myxococcales bacterium]|nr:hypothetical protein [Myxococcales bacterium]
MNSRHLRSLRTLLAGALLMTSVTAFAAAPKTASIEGVLTSTGGGAAADGSYNMTFRVYANGTTKTALWSEGPVSVSVSKGQFHWALGSKTSLDIKKLASTSTPMLGITIGSDPELPRRAIRSVLFAMNAGTADALTCTGCLSASHIANGAISGSKVGFAYAGSATKGGPAKDLACTGCVSVKELKFDGNIDLAGNSIKAKNGTFTGGIAAATVTATAFVGDGSKLTGIKTPSGECKTAGQVVKGINADGSLKCVKAMDPNALPADGLNEISNQLLSNQFVDIIETAQKMVPIPDNTGSDAVSTINFPNIGLTQAFSLSVHVENTDLSKVAMVVLPPNDKKVGWTLCDPCGAKSTKVYKKTFSPTAKPKSGDISKMIGINVKGLWTLKVADTSFCQPQISGDLKWCKVATSHDGWIATWSIKIQTLSNQKVAINGNIVAGGEMKLAGTAQFAGTATFAKDVAFNGNVEFKNPWCPTQPNGERSMVVGGVCTPGVGTYRTWSQAVDFCRAKGADLCSGAQALVMRANGLLPTYTSSGNWTNSWADNDGNQWRDANGQTGDDHSASSRYGAPCCYNNTPKRPTDQIVKMASSDKGLRVVHIHNATDAPFGYAAAFCAKLNADVCTKSQYVYIRSAGKVSVAPLWPNDGEDTDGVWEYGVDGGKTRMSNDTRYDYAYGFACCAGERPTTGCPKGATNTGGVCWLKVNNSGANWVTAARDCGKIGASICTVSQSSVLRRFSIIKHSGNWSGGFNDCDGRCGGSNGIGNGANNLNPNSKYGYACCL